MQRTTSTNDDVVTAARDGAPEGLVIVAEHQTAGRGRLNRQWVSPPGTGLTFSVLLRPAVAEERWTWLPLLTGVALAEACATATGVDVVLKWPNDLLARDRKLGGILATRVESAVVIGIGVNVTTAREDLPVAEATSLLLAGAAAPDREHVLGVALRTLADRYQSWSATGGDPETLRAAYAARCGTLGARIRVALPDGSSLDGTATDIDTDGRLVVETADGEHAVSSGDVVHVRSA